MAMYEHQGPVLDLCWNTAGDKLFSVGVDKAVRMFEMMILQTAQPVTSRQVGVHDDAVRCVKWIDTPTGGILASGSWDKTVRVCLFPIEICATVLCSFYLSFRG